MTTHEHRHTTAARNDDPAALREPTDSQPPGPDEGPRSPAKLGGRSWWQVLKNTAKEFMDDRLIDWAAALTYYGVLSIFPGILVLVSLVGLTGQNTTQTLIDNISEVAPPDAQGILTGAVQGVSNSQGASLIAIVGLLGAFWAASGYIGAFMRASNAVYDVPEGRPIWKTIPIRIATTAVIGLMLIISAFIVVFTGPVAQWAGDFIGLGSAAVTAWGILKWPVLVFLVSTMIAVLYYASPNARQGGFRWVSPGSLLAVVLWIAASVGFSFYVVNFSSYNETYGTLGGVIIFLIWLWISNIAILLGAEFDSEMERQRAIHAGYEDGREPFLQLRDDRTLDDGDAPEEGLGEQTSGDRVDRAPRDR